MSLPHWGCTARRCTGGWRSSGKVAGTRCARSRCRVGHRSCPGGRSPGCTSGSSARTRPSSPSSSRCGPGTLWTRDMVRQVIRREFKISLSVVSVGRLLRTMGLSPQRPLYRAYQQNPEAVQRWKDEQFPAIRKQAKAERATIYFADEAGVRSDYHAGTTWAPVGRTPVVKATGARFSLNMLSAVSAQGALRFMIHEGTVNATVFIDFCKRLLRDHDDPVYLVVDGHPAHRARATTEFVASTDGRLKLFLLPAYSPELNPDEWVWKNVKHDRAGKTAVTSKDDLKATVISALRRLQKLPGLVRGFFADPRLRYITT